MMLDYPQAIVLGIIQGITELFPVSSLGHSVIIPRLLGWHVQQGDPFFLTFLVATHTATAIVLFFFFFHDWMLILRGIARSLHDRAIRREDTDAMLGWLLIIGTIPAGLLGVVFEQKLKDFFANPQLVAVVLIANGVLLYGVERLRKKNRETNDLQRTDERIAKLTFPQAIQVGLLQCIALVPGFSRTGATLAGGLLVGLSHTDAARFSFLLATPIIAAASVLKLPDLVLPAEHMFIGQIVAGSLAAGASAYFSVRFLTKYFQTRTLSPFAFYCVTIGVVASILFLFL